MDKSDEEMAALVDTLDIPIEATWEREELHDWLYRELGKDFSAEGLEKVWKGVGIRYDIMPQVNVSVQHYTAYPGTIKEFRDYRYRDVVTGRWLSKEAAFGRVESFRLGLPWGV